MHKLFETTVKPAWLFARDAANRFLERRNNIQTMGTISLETLELAGEDRVHYRPSEWTTLKRIVPRREVAPDDVFVDFGSGMGRVVFQAARYPFKRVIGVELSERLNDVARANIERNRERLLCREVQLVTSDVLDYAIPDDVTVVYLNNPFTGHIFRTVINRLLESVDRHPRRLRLIYRAPVEHDYLLSSGRFSEVRRLRGLRPGRAWSSSNSTRMYEVTA